MIKNIAKTIIICMSGFVLFTGCSMKEPEVSKLIKVEPNKKIDNNITDSIYEINRKSELANLIKSPAIPVKTPDKIIRVLLMPYVDKNNILQTSSFMFTKVDEGKWIIGDYLNNEGEFTPQTLSPLKN